MEQQASDKSSGIEPWRKYQRACDDWCGPVEEHIFEGQDWASVEQTIHELAHGVSLGIESVNGLSEKVGLAISALPFPDRIEEERIAWAIEFAVLQRLGIPFEEEDVIAGAEIQGVSSSDMWEALDRLLDFEDQASLVIERLEELRQTRG